MNIFFFIDIFLAICCLLCNKSNRKTIFYISASILLLMLCFHDGSGDINGYGYDYPHYLSFFKGKLSVYGSVDDASGYELEWPYFYYCKYLGLLFERTDFVYIFFTGLLCGLPLILLVKKYSNNPAFSMFLVFTIMNTETYLFLIAAHRQMLANALILIAYLISESEIKHRYKWALFLLCIALLSHSSSFFIIPFVLLVYFYKWNVQKRNMIILVITSLMIGLISNTYLVDVLNQAMLFLDDFSLIERSTHYVVNDVFGTKANATLNMLAPLSILSLGILYFSEESETNSFPTKILLLGTCIFNVFNFVPLINRSMTTFILFGIAGAIPDCSYNKRYRVWLYFILILYIYLAYKSYCLPSFRLNPFHFIWE